MMREILFVGKYGPVFIPSQRISNCRKSARLGPARLHKKSTFLLSLEPNASHAAAPTKTSQRLILRHLRDQPTSLPHLSAASRFPEHASLLPHARCGLAVLLSHSAQSRQIAAMASSKDLLWSRASRGAKTIFFVANMLASLLLVCAPPLLIVLLDLLIPSALLAAANRPAFAGAPSFFSQPRSFGFRTSLVDLPFVSITRSLLILGFYLSCSGRGPYLGVTTVCAVASAGYVTLKATAMFGADLLRGQRRLLSFGVKDGPAVEVLLLTSLFLAMAHVVAAYRTTCRERRKLIVYKIDIESVSVYNIEFPNYHKIALSK